MQFETKSIQLPFYVGLSPTLKIRGIIASRKIKKNEIIEKCPVILIPETQWTALQKTNLWNYYYEWNKKFYVIVLGYGSLINHSFSPNSKYTFDFKNKHLVFRSIREIKSGEEITVNYNFDPDSKDPLPPELLNFNKHQK